MTEERVCKQSFVSSASSFSGSIAMESRMRRQEGWEDSRPVTNFLLLEMLEP